MNKKFFIENNNDMNNYSFANDRIVNDFLNKDVSLESLIENEIFKINKTL